MPTVIAIVGIVILVIGGVIYTLLSQPEKPELYKSADAGEAKTRGGAR